MNIKGWYMGWTFDEIQKEGYAPVGRPGLITMMPNMIDVGILEQAVLDANFDQPNLEADSCTLYWKTNRKQGYVPNDTRGMRIKEITGEAGDSNFIIVQPLKRISPQK